MLARLREFLRSPFFPIFTIVFVDVLGMGITIPVMPLYAKDELGASETAVGGIVSLFFLAQMVGAPVLGRASDRIGRRPILLVSQLGTFVAFVLSGLAPALWVLFAARLIDGFTGGNVSTAQAYLSDVTDEASRARGLGLMHAAFGAGFVVGPAMGGLLGGLFGYRVPFYAAAGVCAVSIVLTAWLLPESLRRADAGAEAASAGLGGALEATRELARTSGMASLWWIGFAGSFALMGFHSMFVLWADATLFAGLAPDVIQRRTGVLFALLGVVGIATQLLLVGPAVKWLGERRMVVIGYALRTVGWGGLLLTHQYSVAVPLLMVASMSGGVAQPAMMALLTFAVPEERRGLAIGVQGAVQGAGRVLGPLCTGALFQALGAGWVLVATVVANSLAWLATFGLARAVRGLDPDD